MWGANIGLVTSLLMCLCHFAHGGGGDFGGTDIVCVGNSVQRTATANNNNAVALTIVKTVNGVQTTTHGTGFMMGIHQPTFQAYFEIVTAAHLLWKPGDAIPTNMAIHCAYTPTGSSSLTTVRNCGVYIQLSTGYTKQPAGVVDNKQDVAVIGTIQMPGLVSYPVLVAEAACPPRDVSTQVDRGAWRLRGYPSNKSSPTCATHNLPVGTEYTQAYSAVIAANCRPVGVLNARVPCDTSDGQILKGNPFLNVDSCEGDVGGPVYLTDATGKEIGVIGIVTSTMSGTNDCTTKVTTFGTLSAQEKQRNAQYWHDQQLLGRGVLFDCFGNGASIPGIDVKCLTDPPNDAWYIIQ